MSKHSPSLLLVRLAVIALMLAACAQPTLTAAPTLAPTQPPPPTLAPTIVPTIPPPPTPTAVPTEPPGVPAADVENLVNGKFNTVDRNLALWNIQPGLGTVMIEYGNRLARLFYAENAGNWDMAKYQLDEMVEIQEVGETTRPNRAEMLKAFEDKSLQALDQAILGQDKAAFTTAFNDTIAGCNSCHASSKGTNWASYQFVDIQTSKVDPAFYVDWKGDGQGNYIANPAAAPTAAPQTPLTGNLDAAGVEGLVNGKFNAVDRNLALWNIQPGLGTVMMEYGNRFGRLWFSANAGNWDMAKYQLAEMIEIQEVGETTRPNRAKMLKAFEEQYLAALDKTIDAKDKTAFTTAYNDAVGGCNTCHASSKGSNWASYQFVKIQTPAKDNSDYLVWKATQGTGNYIANPAAAPTAAPQAPLTGVLDITGVEALVNGKFNAVDRNLALWNIQPGLGTVMIEYGNRLARLFYASNGGNWDMAKYQLDEMVEIQEVGETTRPNRAEMLKAFEDKSLQALDQAILAQDKAAFTTAFNDTVTGCNSCHTSSKGANWASYGYVQIQLPPTDPADYLKWKTSGGTGNYIKP